MNTTTRMTGPPPHFAIFLDVEGGIRVHCNSMNDSEETRLRDWIDTHPELRELLDHAIELEHAREAEPR